MLMDKEQLLNRHVSTIDNETWVGKILQTVHYPIMFSQKGPDAFAVIILLKHYLNYKNRHLCVQ